MWTVRSPSEVKLSSLVSVVMARGSSHRSRVLRGLPSRTLSRRILSEAMPKLDEHSALNECDASLK